MAKDWTNSSAADIAAEVDRLKSIEHVPVDLKDYFPRPLAETETPEQRNAFLEKLHAVMTPQESTPDLMASKYLRLDVSDLSRDEFDALVARRRRTWHDDSSDPILELAFNRQDRRGKLAAMPAKT